MLDDGDKVVKVEQYGTSSWASTARVDIVKADGSPDAYFLKVRINLADSTKS